MFRTYLLMYGMLMFMSIVGVCVKAAAGQVLFSAHFYIYLCCAVSLMGLYAIGWQQVMKRLSLTAAYANKAVTIIWGIIWGNIFFHESVTAGKVAGSLLVAAGVAIYGLSERKQDG